MTKPDITVWITDTEALVISRLRLSTQITLGYELNFQIYL